MPGSDLHALLIGIDHYPPPDGLYPDLKGAVADASAMKHYLRKDLQIPEARIQALTSTATPSGEPLEPASRRPTYDNMVCALERLRLEANPGDQVLIYYSGHGGRTRTLIPEIKGAKAFDESLVPSDIGNPDEPYLRDVELILIVQQMLLKELYVNLVLDCCHSGSALRGRSTPRGIRTVDFRQRPATSKVASIRDLARHWQKLLSQGKSLREARPSKSWLPYPQRYACLAACQPRARAYEFPFRGEGYRGVLTHYLLSALRHLGPGAKSGSLSTYIQSQIESSKNHHRRQVPLLQGDPDQPFFRGRPQSLTARYSVPGVEVIEVDSLRNCVRLQTGRVHGVHPGARVAIYSPTSDSQTQAPTEAVVVESGAESSWAAVESFSGRSSLEVGAKALLIAPESATWRPRKVALPNDESDFEDTMSLLADALKPHRSWLDLAAPGEFCDFQMKLANGHYEILNSSGEPLLALGPALPARAVEEIAERLLHLARYQFVAEINNADPRAPRLEAELYPLPPGYDPDRPETIEGAEPGKVIKVKSGSAVCLVIRNPAVASPWRGTLNVTVLDLDPDWGIEQIYPWRDEAAYEPLDRGGEVWVPLNVSLTEGLPRGRDILKVFASTEPTRFHHLEERPLSTSKKSTTTRGSVETPEALFSSAFDRRSRRLGSGRRGENADRYWTVQHLEIHLEHP